MVIFVVARSLLDTPQRKSPPASLTPCGVVREAGEKRPALRLLSNKRSMGGCRVAAPSPHRSGGVPLPATFPYGEVVEGFLMPLVSSLVKRSTVSPVQAQPDFGLL
ncbi:hypothetical protein CRG98_024827 [Punica granatum]|uniref:Uncharacterized protein n=1 Tax=Punica granatum TaxID=22663 RepID=A0A2I0JEU2_PUNGR|nr:hypothetical protein CRG98_024827 [Punica granatum]